MSAATIPAATFLAALALRLAYLAQLHDSGLWDYLRLDPLYYHDWAVRLAAGREAADQPYEMTPLYAYALGGLFRLAGYGLLLPRVVQALMGAATCALASLLALRLFGRKEAWLAGAAAALYGPALFHESQIMKTVATVTLSTMAAAALHSSSGRSPRWLLGAGGLLGLTALAQENVNVTLPILLGWIVLQQPAGPGRARSGLRCGAALVAGWAAVVAPATLRNYAVSGDVVLITSGGGEVFYTGNNEHASGHYRPPAFVRPDPFFEHQDFRAEAARRLGRPVTRKESDAFWWKEGFRFIREHPARYVALLGNKLSTFFNGFERPDNYSYYNFARFIPLLGLPLVQFSWVAPPGILGLALSARRWRELVPLHAVIGAYVLSALLFFTQDRYRMPMVPLLIVFAAHGALSVARAAVRKELKRLAWLAAALTALVVFVNLPAGNELAFEAQNHGILGEMYLHAGRPADAKREFLSAISMLERYPGDSTGEQHRRVVASCHFGIVLALEQAEGEDSAAGPDSGRAAHLRSAADSPDADLRRDALDRLGALLMEQRDPAAAAQAYQEALEADGSGPGSFGRRLRLAQALHQAGRAAEALEAARLALLEGGSAGAAERASAHYGMALIYLHDLPEPGEAARHLREVLRLDPAHPRAAWIRETLSTLPGGSP